MSDLSLGANYLYWQQHGHTWLDEYDRRKKRQVLYHLQEIMLADYMTHSAPACVLEVGCGFGRHLAYLSHIPGLDVYGCDQSLTMLAGFTRWADRNWIRKHIVLVDPVGRLPYPDGFFDIVYTVETLVHVHPEDLPRLLAELSRVAKWQILHIETASGYPLVADAHCGCWYHDLVQVYEQLGYECSLLPQGYKAHAFYRVVLDTSRPIYSGSPVLASLLRRMENDLQGEIKHQEQERAMLHRQLEAAQLEVRELKQRCQELEQHAICIQQNLEQQVWTLQTALDQQSRALAENSIQHEAALSRIEELSWQVEDLKQSLERFKCRVQEQQAEIRRYTALLQQLSAILSSPL